MRHFFTFSLLCFCFLSTANAPAAGIDRTPGAGLAPYMSLSDAKKYLSSDNEELKSVMVTIMWKDVEPQKGQYKLDKLLSPLLPLARAKNRYISILFWVGNYCPPWLYDEGVPTVKTAERFVGRVDIPAHQGIYPYYFSDIYIKHHALIVEAWGNYFKSLSTEDVSRFVYFHVCEGSTGDTRPYQAPIDAKYDISMDKWMDYRVRVWEQYKTYFAHDGKFIVPILLTDDANRDKDREWQLNNCDIIGVKKGQFAHAYDNSDTADMLVKYREFIRRAEDAGKILFARGEYDKKLATEAPWVRRDPVQAFYWSALMALHTRIDYWNPFRELMDDPRLLEAMQFYNRHAGWRNAAAAPCAFCAFKDVLDSDNTKRFPEAAYGRASRKNMERYAAICRAYKVFGARIEDPAVLGEEAMVTRYRKGNNDVGWNMIEGNFFQYLQQIDPDGTSLSWFNVDNSSPYGRFARSTDIANGKTKIYLRLDPQFATNSSSLTVRLKWFDESTARWSLHYYNKDVKRDVEAIAVSGTRSKKWITTEVLLTSVVCSGLLEKGSDFIIEQETGPDTKWHMVEVAR
jgi:hypothetical protein